MSLIDWKPEFSVGIPSVDYEHQQLVGLINDGHENLVQKTGLFSTQDFLGEVFAKISSHFALEEKIMREANYDMYQEHKQDHEKLLDQIRDIMDVYESEGYFNDEELAEHLQNWFTNHFKNQDARLHNKLGPH